MIPTPDDVHRAFLIGHQEIANRNVGGGDFRHLLKQGKRFFEVPNSMLADDHGQWHASPTADTVGSAVLIGCCAVVQHRSQDIETMFRLTRLRVEDGIRNQLCPLLES